MHKLLGPALCAPQFPVVFMIPKNHIVLKALHICNSYKFGKRLMAVICARTEAVDVWAHREFLPKAWQEIVTMRLLLRGPSLTELGGSGPRPSFAVKWQMPYSDRIENFQVAESVLVPC
jgi:hypothetical protein